MITNYKIEIIHINISSTFLIKNRCKACGKHPSDYYYIRKCRVYKDIDELNYYSKSFKKRIGRFILDWYLDSDPKFFCDIKDFSFCIRDKSYLPRLHNTRGEPSNNKDHVIEMLGCECGKTTWAFNNKSIKNSPEIINRKGRYGYPRKFEY
jgi:hypothetical protein